MVYALAVTATRSPSDSAVCVVIGPIEARVAAGDEVAITAWLGRRVWPLGRRVSGEELVERLSGRPLEATPFLRHLETKLAALAD